MYSCTICLKLYNFNEIPMNEAGRSEFRCANCAGKVARRDVEKIEVVVAPVAAPRPAAVAPRPATPQQRVVPANNVYRPPVQQAQASAGDTLIGIIAFVIMVAGGIWFLSWLFGGDFEMPKTIRIPRRR
jgi:hypothetical protein